MRISGLNESSADTELVISKLWDLGTTGVYESAVTVAGFDSKVQADQAVAGLSSAFDLPTIHFVVEPAPPIEHWQPPGHVSKVELLAPGQGPLSIKIDAGPTFGHGQHPTTRLALELMASTLDRGHKPLGSNQSVLDVGTGSGILAIAAAKLGADPVVAIDNDPAAATIAATNAANNRVGIDSSTATMAEVARRHPAGFDIVAINVLLPVHAELAQAVLGSLSEHGRVITTGYLVSQSSELLAHYQPLGARSTSSIDDWAGHVLAR